MLCISQILPLMRTLLFIVNFTCTVTSYTNYLWKMKLLLFSQKTSLLNNYSYISIFQGFYLEFKKSFFQTCFQSTLAALGVARDTEHLALPLLPAIDILCSQWGYFTCVADCYFLQYIPRHFKWSDYVAMLKSIKRWSSVRCPRIAEIFAKIGVPTTSHKIFETNSSFHMK